METEKIVVDIVVYDTDDIDPLCQYLNQQAIDILSGGFIHVRISVEKLVRWPSLWHELENWPTVKRYDVVTVPKH